MNHKNWNKEKTNHNLKNIKTYREEDEWRIPEFQRTDVWTKKQRQLFIDSLIRGIDIPKLYLHLKKEDGKIHYDVVDGQQRITTIIKFMNNDFPLGLEESIYFKDDSENELKGKFFSEFPPNSKRLFEYTSLDVVEFRDFTDEDVREVFVRQQMGSPLNAAEKRKALKSNVGSISNEFSNNNKVFLQSGFLRYKDVRDAYRDTTDKILHEFINGEISGISPGQIENTYNEHDAIANNHKRIVNVKKALNLVYKIFDGTEPRFSKVEIRRITYLVNELSGKYNFKDYAYKFKKIFNDFEAIRHSELEKDEPDPRYLEYKNALRSDSVATQKYVHEFLIELVLEKIPEMIFKDENREFSESQKRVIFNLSNRKCNLCEIQLTRDTFQADHVAPHSKGGRTSISNGQALCGPCNKKKGARTDI